MHACIQLALCHEAWIGEANLLLLSAWLYSRLAVAKQPLHHHNVVPCQCASCCSNTPEGNADLLSDRPLDCWGENHLDLRLAVPLDHPLLGNHQQAAELDLPLLL